MNMMERWWEGGEHPSEPVLLNIKQVLERVPTKWPTTLYGWIRKGTFPKPRRHGNRSYWIESEVDAWKRLMPMREE